MTSKNSILNHFNENRNSFLLLLLIVLLGAYLRAYHMDYSVLGYHNWKETHYLTEARNFARDGFFQHGFFTPEWDYPELSDDPSGVHADTFPTISILAGLSFKLFGFELWAARLVGVLFSLGSIVLMFLFVKKLFKREDMALTAAALTAICPLFVFFSHNVQLINPGLFFMLAAGYYFLRWRESDNGKELVISVLFLMLTTLTKYPFLLIAIPMLLVFPFKRFKENFKKDLKYYATSILLLIPIPIWFFHMKAVEAKLGATTVSTGLIDFGVLYTGAWWRAMRSYVADNYTMLGFALAFVGLGLMLLFYKKSFGNKFMTYYAIGSVPWLFVMADKLGQHSYHQYPIAPMFLIFLSYFFVVIGTNLAGFFAGEGESRKKRIRAAKFVLILVMFLLVLTPALKAKNRQFDTQFPGLDIAGEYIKEHSSAEERVLFSRGQSFGMLWHADRKGYGIMIPTVGQIKESEEKGVTWIFLYQWGLQTMQSPESWKYIKDNYALRQFGFYANNDQVQPVFLLFQKGGTFNEEVMNEMIDQEFTKSYELTSGATELKYVTFKEE